MPFADLHGQDRAIGSLRAALRRGTLHHAYLFAGPKGAGKAAAARALAQAANCERGGDDACGACGPCRKVEKNVHPDVLVLREERAMVKAGVWEPKGGRTPSKDVVVDQVRDVVDRWLALKRHEGRRRFVVVDPADAMNVQAQNALLKTLEEPPPETTLVLVASSPDVLLPTIRSRCVRVPFVPVGDGGLAALVERAGAAIDDAAALDPRNAATWIAWAREHGGDRDAAKDTCAVLLAWLRDVLAAQASPGAPLAIPAHAEATRRTAAAISPAEALRRRAAVEEALLALKQNAGAALALERMLVGWFHHG